MNIKNINSISKVFFQFTQEDNCIYEVVNKVPKSSLQNLYSYYREKSKHYKYERVVKTRMLLLKHLLNSRKLNEQIVERIKNHIIKKARANNYQRDIFHSWKPNWRILFPIYYEQYREEVINFLHELANRLSVDLGIEDIIKVKIIDFNDAHHFGSSRCWFAIYNKSHSTQQTAFQLFFSLKNGVISYGLYKYGAKNFLINKNVTNYKYENILLKFKKYINIIKRDIKETKNGTKPRGRKGKLRVNVDDYFRKDVKSIKVEQRHKKIQNILSESLRGVYGGDASVSLEEDFIDIKVEGKNFIDIYEIKTYESAIYCVRDAIGQLLLYASRLNNASNKRIKLIVVGLGEDNLDVVNFKKYLLNNFGFDFTYKPYLEIK